MPEKDESQRLQEIIEVIQDRAEGEFVRADTLQNDKLANEALEHAVEMSDIADALKDEPPEEDS